MLVPGVPQAHAGDHAVFQRVRLNAVVCLGLLPNGGSEVPSIHFQH
jgi:hypothetical protein